MNKKAIFFICAILLTGCLVTSCDLIPDFSRQPSISFKGITPFRLNSPLRDSLIITISFQDGDGNLGLSAQDVNPPFNADTTVNGQRQANPFFFNYHISTFKKMNGSFVLAEFATPNFNFNGRFPVLKPDGESGPIEGELDYSVRIEPPQSFINERFIQVGDTLQFEIFIYDRDLKKSNTVRTSEVVVLSR